MAGYQGLGRIQDPATQAVCKSLFDLIAALDRRLTTLEGVALTRAQGAVDAGTARLTNLSAPSAGADAVTLAYLRGYVAAQLDAFKGSGVNGTIDTTAAQLVTVENGLITEIV